MDESHGIVHIIISQLKIFYFIIDLTDVTINLDDWGIVLWRRIHLFVMGI